MLYIFKKGIDANIKCVYLKHISLIYVLKFLLLAQNFVCSLLYGSYNFIYSQRGLHINLLGLLFLYKVRGFSTFYRNKPFQVSYAWDFFAVNFSSFSQNVYSVTEALAKKYLLLQLCLLVSFQTNPSCWVTAFSQNHTAKASTPVFWNINFSS